MLYLALIDAERRELRAHAERGRDQTDRVCRLFRVAGCRVENGGAFSTRWGVHVSRFILPGYLAPLFLFFWRGLLRLSNQLFFNRQRSAV